MGKLMGIEQLFEGRHFDREVIILCVRCYLRFKLSQRDLVEMMAERGLSGRETANRHDAGLKGLCDRGDYDRRYRIDASHPQGTIRTGTSVCPRPTCACSVECRAPCLKPLDRHGTLSCAGYLHQSPRFALRRSHKKSARSLISMVGAQGLEPWTR